MITPEAALDAPCPGYRPADGGEPVARSAQCQREETAPRFQSQQLPRRRCLRICPGYRSADGCKPVARLSAARAGEKPHRCINPGAFPGLRRCAPYPGHRPADGCKPVARLSAARAGEKVAPGHQNRLYPGSDAAHLSGLQNRDCTNLIHDHLTQILRKALILHLINRLRITQHNQLMIGYPLMIGRVAM